MSVKCKMIMFVLAVVLGFSVSADMLFWQINSDTGIADATLARLVATDMSATEYTARTFDSYTGDKNNAIATTYYDSDHDMWTETSVPVGSINFGGVTIEGLANSDISGITDRNFLIELLNAQNAVVGRSNAMLTYDSLGSYVHDGMPTDFNSLSIWNPGAFTAVPEPTSGLLFLIGGALLGLRRKKRA